MKKILYTTHTEDGLMKKLSYLGQENKPKMFRSREKDMHGRPIKMFKLTVEIEEVPQSQISFYMTKEDLKNKYTSEQISAGYQRYSRNPYETTRSDDSYSTWKDMMRWDELMADEQEKFIKAEM